MRVGVCVCGCGGVVKGKCDKDFKETHRRNLSLDVTAWLLLVRKR
jgi:hypothetical protein